MGQFKKISEEISEKVSEEISGKMSGKISEKISQALGEGRVLASISPKARIQIQSLGGPSPSSPKQDRPSGAESFGMGQSNLC